MSEPAPVALRGRFFSLKWKTLALLSLVLAAVHLALVLQAYWDEISQFEQRQALAFEERVGVLQKLLAQSESRLQRIGTIVPGVIDTILARAGIEEQWASLQIDLQLEVMQLYRADGSVQLRGVTSWGGPLSPELTERIRQFGAGERPAGFLLCDPNCVQYAVVPVLGGGERRLMVLGSSLADVVLEFPGLTRAGVALLAAAGPGGGSRFWQDYRLEAISDAPTNEPKLRMISEQAPLATLDEGRNLVFGGRHYRFAAWPLESFGGLTSGYVVIFADTTDALRAIRSQVLRQLVAALFGLLAALALLLAVLNRPMNQLRKLAQALPLLARHQYAPAREVIGSQYLQARNHTEIEVLEAVSVDLAEQLERLERTVAARGTALAESLAELKRANELNEKIFATAPMLILIQSGEGRVLQINEFGSQLLGYSPAEVRGMAFLDLLADPRQRDAAAAVLVEVIGGRRALFEQTGPVRCVDGSSERITWLHTRLTSQSGTFVLSVGLADKSLEDRAGGG